MRGFGNWVLVGVAAGAFGGCGKTVDSKGYEKTLVKEIEEKMGIAGATVDCPDGVKAEVGKSFVCKVTLEQVAYDFNVEIKAVDGSELSMATGFARGIAFPKAKLVPVATAAFKEKTGQDPTLDCGAEPLLFAEDGKLVCDLSVGSERGKLEMTTSGVEVTGWEFKPQ